MSIISFLTLLIILLLITEIISIIFKITGLNINTARFQIISIITHTGFTTKESELISQHPTRRRIASYLMIISYGAQISMISILVSMLKDSRQSILILLAALLIMVLLLVVITRSKYMLLKLENLLEKIILRQMKINKKYRPVDEVLKLNNDFGVSEIFLNESSSLVGITLKNTGLKQKYIQVLNVDRGSEIIHFPDPNFTFQAADKVLVYGKIDAINELILKQYI